MSNRYSHLIPLLSLIIDLLIINVVVFVVNDSNYLNPSFLLFATIFWFISTQITNYYHVTRQTSIFRVFSLIAVQVLLYALGFFAYFNIFREGEVVHNQFKILVTTVTLTSILKLLTFYALKKYRRSGMNYRKVALIGYDESSKSVIQLFKNRPDLGYRFQGFFTDKEVGSNEKLGNLKESFSYLSKNGIDELFCSVKSLKKKELKEFKKFANENDIVLKLIPEVNELYSKNVNAEYYDNTLILNVKKLPLEIRSNRAIKRAFDIIFSLFILIFVMSWLTPILGLLIRLESKGGIFFKQERGGLKGKNFSFYKFRSMKINKDSDLVDTKKNDTRVTKVGTFLRRTSIDELPQFYNVLKGDMSVVGPRPHMSLQSLRFEEEVDNYIERHAIKPGITGLAQVSGCRGEITKKSDIENRVRYDIFYIENWSFLLDIKIIVKTISNIFKGEEKAY